MTLHDFGWDEYWQHQFITAKEHTRDLSPARVLGVDRSLITLGDQDGVFRGRLTGRLLRQAKEEGLPVCVGDWVACRRSDASTNSGAVDDPAGVLEVLARRTVIQRKRAISGGRKIVNDEVTGGKTEAQVVAANVDLACIVCPLDQDSEPGAGLSRIERSMALCASGGVEAVAVYNKADLARPNLLPLILETAGAVCPQVLAVSAKTGWAMEGLEKLLRPGVTAVFFGPSGAGKSSLVNALMGEGEGFVPLSTGPISQITGKGLHTTTRRELICLPGGAMVIDTPGMRELALWADESALSETFDDIVELAGQCRFSDCGHQGEPGCAVREALDSGELDPRRYDNFVRMHSEVQRLDMRRIALWQKLNAKSKRYFDLDHR